MTEVAQIFNPDTDSIKDTDSVKVPKMCNTLLFSGRV